MMRADVAVIGGGAAGLMAARRAALAGAAVVVLEGNPKPGKKLLATGNGRCNLTNLELSAAHYRGDVEAILERVPAQRVIKEFEAMGLLTRADEQGRVYPNSLQAAAVLRALWSACEEAGVELTCGFAVDAVIPSVGGFILTAADGRKLTAGKVILTTGGKASPKFSAKPGGYSLAKSLGHKVTELKPGLTALRSSSKVCNTLKGQRVRAKATLICKSQPLYSESGEVIFGDGQLSGICIFNLASRLGSAENVSVSLDLLEQMEPEAITKYLTTLAHGRPGLPVSDLFSGALPLRVGQEVVKAAGLPKEKTIGQLTAQEIARAVQAVKSFDFPITVAVGWENAQVTRGGVPLCEVDPETMESKKCPGLYLAGELLDVDGDCGGYNLHWAWASGLIAGDAAGKGAR